jgi:hypothetical protein
VRFKQAPGHHPCSMKLAKPDLAPRSGKMGGTSPPARASAGKRPPERSELSQPTATGCHPADARRDACSWLVG